MAKLVRGAGVATGPELVNVSENPLYPFQKRPRLTKLSLTLRDPSARNSWHATLISPKYPPTRPTVSIRSYHQPPRYPGVAVGF
jgi:hypothetical protein